MPWHLIRAMRNWFAHDYYAMDINRIWETATKDISALREFCESVLNSDNS